jgi:lysophospholipase L1-like esterase
MHFRTNSLGLRERENPWSKKTDVRIAVLGDSFTEGVGADPEESWPGYFKSRLEADSLDVSVYNAGASGSDPFYCLALLRDKILDMDPTHVIFCINTTDWGDYIFRGGFERFQSDSTTVSRPAPPIEPLYARSHVARMLCREFLGYSEILIRNDQMPVQMDEATINLAACIDSAFALCAQRNIRFLLVSHLIPAEICPGGRPIREIERMRKFHFEFPWIELNADLCQKLQPLPCDDWRWPVDGHFKAKGYEVMSQLIAQDILNRYPNWLPPAP